MSEYAGIESVTTEFAGSIIVTWPPARDGGMPGWGFAVHDATTGKQLFTVCEMSVHLEAEAFAWAEVLMFADAEGQPAYGPDIPLTAGGNPLKRSFRFAIAEMRAAVPGDA